MNIVQLLKHGEDYPARCKIVDSLRELIERSEEGLISLPEFSDTLLKLSDKARAYRRTWDQFSNKLQ